MIADTHVSFRYRKAGNGVSLRSGRPVYIRVRNQERQVANAMVVTAP